MAERMIRVGSVTYKLPVVYENDEIYDADGFWVGGGDPAAIINTLHAEVERLKETQRKLAVIVNRQERRWRDLGECRCQSRTIAADEMVTVQLISKLLDDQQVAAAIKEASDGKA